MKCPEQHLLYLHRYTDAEQQSNKISTAVRARGSDVKCVALANVYGTNFDFVTDGSTFNYFIRERQLEKFANYV